MKAVSWATLELDLHTLEYQVTGSLDLRDVSSAGGAAGGAASLIPLALPSRGGGTQDYRLYYFPSQSRSFDEFPGNCLHGWGANYITGSDTSAVKRASPSMR